MTADVAGLHLSAEVAADRFSTLTSRFPFSFSYYAPLKKVTVRPTPVYPPQAPILLHGLFVSSFWLLASVFPHRPSQTWASNFFTLVLEARYLPLSSTRLTPEPPSLQKRGLLCVFNIILFQLIHVTCFLCLCPVSGTVCLQRNMTDVGPTLQPPPSGDIQC